MPTETTFSSYETATISLIPPLSQQIQRHFPDPVSSADQVRDFFTMLTQEQLHHAYATPPLRSGIQMAADIMFEQKKASILAIRMRLQQLQIDDALAQLQKQLTTAETEQKAMIEESIHQLNEISSTISERQTLLNQLQKRLTVLQQSQEALTVEQDNQWITFEKNLVNDVFAQLYAANATLDKDIVKTVSQPATLKFLKDIISRYEATADFGEYFDNADAK